MVDLVVSHIKHFIDSYCVQFLSCHLLDYSYSDRTPFVQNAHDVITLISTPNFKTEASTYYRSWLIEMLLFQTSHLAP